MSYTFKTGGNEVDFRIHRGWILVDSYWGDWGNEGTKIFYSPEDGEGLEKIAIRRGVPESALLTDSPSDDSWIFLVKRKYVKRLADIILNELKNPDDSEVKFNTAPYASWASDIHPLTSFCKFLQREEELERKEKSRNLFRSRFTSEARERIKRAYPDAVEFSPTESECVLWRSEPTFRLPCGSIIAIHSSNHEIVIKRDVLFEHAQRIRANITVFDKFHDYSSSNHPDRGFGLSI